MLFMERDKSKNYIIVACGSADLKYVVVQLKTSIGCLEFAAPFSEIKMCADLRRRSLFSSQLMIKYEFVLAGE